MSIALSQLICTHLFWGVSGVPQGISQVLTRPCGRVDHFDWQARVALSSRGCVGPVGLCDLFPHHGVEAGAGLVAKHEPGVVVISVSVNEERSTEIHSAELIVTWIVMRDGLELPLFYVDVFSPRYFSVCYIPTAMPGSQLTVCTSSLPWCLTTQLGSIWEVPLGSRGTIWNLRKSVSLMAKFSGHTSKMSRTLSWSKSSLHTSPRPLPERKV